MNRLDGLVYSLSLYTGQCANLDFPNSKQAEN